MQHVTKKQTTVDNVKRERETDRAREKKSMILNEAKSKLRMAKFVREQCRRTSNIHRQTCESEKKVSSNGIHR